MGLNTWLVAALGLGSLVVLIAVSMLASSRKTQDIYAQLDQLNAHHRSVEARLRALRSDVHDLDDKPFGGDALLILNNELRFRLMSIMDDVTFLGAGNVFERPRRQRCMRRAQGGASSGQ